MELEYLEDIREDVYDLIKNDMKYGKSKFEPCVARVIHENDLYMSDKKPIERDCHYISIGAYAVETNNIDNIIDNVKNEIKRSVEVIKSGKYDESFTNEDKKYIYEDIKTIENSDLLK